MNRTHENAVKKLTLEISQMRIKLKDQLENLLVKVHEQALKDEEVLKKHSHIHNAWVEAKASMDGTTHMILGVAKGSVTGLWHAGEIAVHEVTEFIRDPKEESRRVQLRVSSSAHMITFLAQDHETHHILKDFAQRYYRVASPLQIAYIGGEIAGAIIPGILIGMLTRTLASAAVATGIGDSLLETQMLLDQIIALNQQLSKATHLAESIADEGEALEGEEKKKLKKAS